MFWFYLLVLKIVHHATGQDLEYKLTGSAAFAVLGSPFTWTCEMFIPGSSVNAVIFYRNKNKCALIGYKDNECYLESYNDRYTYACLPELTHQYTLTIPAENMTENEQGLIWYCEIPGGKYVSPEVSLKIAIDVHNASLIPNKNLLTIREGNQTEVRCVVNSNALPAPTITWYLGSTDITNIAGTDTTSITITGNRMNNKNMLICRAENNNKTKTANTTLNVEYPPVVSPISQLNIVEGSDVSFNCTFTQGNPDSTIIFWTSKNKPEFRQNGTTLLLPEIKRTNSGNYTCTAENKYSDEEKGSDSKSMILNVLYPPTMESNVLFIVNETETITLKQVISSNPLSNITWYEEAKLLKTETLVRTTTHTIQKAMCTDTKNFTLVASNGVGDTITTVVEVIVNCKPRSSDTNITLGVTDTTGIDFSTTVIAYPQPEFELLYENGTRNNQMMERITRNRVYNFTIHYNQTVVAPNDYGTYLIRFSNVFGEATMYVIVIPQRKPSMPTIDNFLCGVTSARVQWISSFDGGDAQWFTIIALNSQYIESKSDNISDKGIKKIHSASVQNLKPSTMYVLYVIAQNSHGLISSENISCTTEKESSDSLPLIAGSAAVGGGLTLAVVVIAVFMLSRRYTKQENKGGKSERFENEVVENEEADDDGMRDNILYVSADPKVDEKPEAAVYAAVNKRSPESNNNANVYAEVNKSGHIVEGVLYSDVKPKRGLFKKDVRHKKDGNPKQKKGKKQKSKQDVADVYENSEDIAMSSKSGNVYSNTGQKVQKKEERGHKNKDGLLYVEVQFDAKTEKGNQTIHGEDEKTDYATVEFPMAASKHDESGNEKL